MTRLRWRERRGWPRTAEICALLALLLVGPTPLAAQIYEWVGDDGTRHFTDSKDGVPEAESSRVRLFMAPAPMSRIDDGYEDVPASRVDDTEDKVQRRLERERQRSLAEAEALHRGWQLGFEAAEAQRLPAVIQIEPPVVVLEPPPPPIPVVESPRYDPSGQYYVPPSEDAMTVPFDRGRSRGLTHRQHLEGRIQRERDAR